MLPSLVVLAGLLALGASHAQASPGFGVSSADKVKIGQDTSFEVSWQEIPEDVEVSLYGDWFKETENGTQVGNLAVYPQVFLVMEGNGSLRVNVSTYGAGKFDILFNCTSLLNGSATCNSSDIFTSQHVEVEVIHSFTIATVNVIIGWVYFAAWSVSFYPQIFTNYRRKSVIGLNFDFLSYNLMGFFMYGLFNVGLFWIHEVQREFHKAHPHSVIPVQANDVAFTLHAFAATTFTVLQACIYDRGNQRVSYFARVLVAGSWLMVFVTLFVTIAGKYSWLNYLYMFSYVKLGVTLIKYVPQAYMNYRRKSTVGWSIGNVLLDFTGGSLSMLQMLLMGYNYDDWKSIFQDPTKFGLGMFSVLFDILFMVQHYILYRPYRRYRSLPAVNHVDTPSYANN
ncbi:cystinosin-like [Sycon ciliatum]|uniref:cystinosin-like n=1 Tax=Sycon ciliatum TaxID=27933 RepID=UPI0031F70FDE